MLNLFSGAPQAAAAATKHRSKQTLSKSGTTLSTVSAGDYAGTPMAAGEAVPTKAAHAFNAPEAEQVLGLRRLLVKVVGAKDLADGGGPRPSW